MPAPAAASVGRPHIFRTLFYKDIGGVSGASDAWVDCSYAAIDGSSLRLQSLIDYIDSAHLFTQSGSGQQPTAPATDASFASALTCTYATAYLDSNRASSLWDVYHTGAGGTQYAVYIPTTISPSNYVLHSTGNASTQNSIALGIAGSTHYFQVFKTAASNSIIINTSVSASVNVATYHGGKYASAASPNWELRKKSALANSGAQAFTPGSGAPQATMRIGASAVAAASFFLGRHRASYFFRRVINSSEQVVLQSWVQKDTGITP
jgi:hypothetical protein